MKNKGFTLIELIVVITILAILGTIAFIGFKGYTGDARNSKITTDISNLNNALGILKASEGFVPMPDSSVKVESGAGNTITFEGEVGDNVRSSLKASKDMVSPNGENYKYAVNGNQKQFTLVAELEEETANFSSSVYAADEKVKMFKGDKVVTLFDVNGDFVGGDITGSISGLDSAYLGEDSLTITTGVVEELPPEIKENQPFREINYLAKYHLEDIANGKLPNRAGDSHEGTVMNGLTGTAFDGTASQYVRVDSLASTLEGGKAFTVGVKFKGGIPGGTAYSNVMFAINGKAPYENVFRYNVSPNAGKLGVLNIYDPKLTTPHQQNDKFLDNIVGDGNYHTVIGVVNPKQGKLITYLDGVKVSEDPMVTKSYDIMTYATIGGEYDGANIGDYFTGDIDKVFVVGGDLSEGYVSSLDFYLK